MKKELKVCWISAGVSSFIAGYLAENVDEYIYIDIDNQHEDSMRFIKDCEKALDNPIQVIKSKYGSVENVIRATSMVKSPHYAPCTDWLKKRVRKEWEDLHTDYDLTYIWGFDLDEKNRADRLLESMPKFTHEFPLL